MTEIKEEHMGFKDILVHETKTFMVCVPKTTHIPRTDGGHLWIRAKNKSFSDRMEMNAREATELMRLTLLTGEAMIAGMKRRGVVIERINFQENGNWAYLKGAQPKMHIHLYGRTKNSVTQTWGEALVFPNRNTGFYDNFEPFNEEDRKAIQEEIARLEQTEKYDLKTWGLE